MRIFAVCTTLEGGYKSDQKRILESNIQIGDKIEVETIHVYDWYTEIWLVGHEESFNSIYFEFIDDNGNEYDIYKDKNWWYC